MSLDASRESLLILSERLIDPRAVLGRRGEAVAESVLVRQGLRILARRYRTRLGEIDLVALDGEIVVFVEVKARRGTDHGSPAEAVTARKQRRIAAAALSYLKTHELLDRTCRFDVLEVLHHPVYGFRVRHLRDVFRGD